MGYHSFFKFSRRSPRQHVATPARLAGLLVVLSGPSAAKQTVLLILILATPVVQRNCAHPARAPQLRKKDNRQAIHARPAFARSQKTKCVLQYLLLKQQTSSINC